MAIVTKVEVTENDDSESNISDDSEEASVEDNTENEESDQNEEAGNSGWADAMASILKPSHTSKNLILSKAKKDADISFKDEDKKNIIDVAPADGDEETVIESDKPLIKEEKKSTRNRILKKKLWEEMNRLKPSVTEREAERKFSRIATRGVVQLFNAVRVQQKTVESKLKEAGHSEVKKEKILKTYNKSSFLDMLKGTKEPAQKKQKVQSEQSSWSVLRDDFMLGATMKDWDKDDSEHEMENLDVT